MLFRKLIHTTEDHAITVVRVVVGGLFFVHGAQKALGWFGGNGFRATMAGFTGHMGIPAFFAVLAILAEFLGGIGLILGLLSRVAAFGIATNMAVAIVMVHARNGLFLNWTGAQRGEGIEYHLLVISMTILLMVRGSGAWSVDRALESWLTGGRTLHIQMEPQPSSDL